MLPKCVDVDSVDDASLAVLKSARTNRLGVEVDSNNMLSGLMTNLVIKMTDSS